MERDCTNRPYILLRRILCFSQIENYAVKLWQVLNYPTLLICVKLLNLHTVLVVLLNK